MDLIDLQKKELRQNMALTREKASYEHGSFIPSIKDKIDPLIKEHKIIAGYYPIRSEINIVPFLLKAQKEGYGVALPVLQGEKLLFKIWEQSLILGPFGIPCPREDSKTVEPTLIFIPGLAFTKGGVRLGYGKAHYDKAFQKMTELSSIHLCGICYEGQILSDIPHSPLDIKVNTLITPCSIYKLS